MLSQKTKKHYHWLDLLRFIAAFLVVLTHNRGMFFVEYNLLPAGQKNIFTQALFFLTRFAEEPVIVFFVLSGFLVGGNAIERIMNNTVDIRLYCIDRFVRIFLPLLASSLLVIIIFILSHNPVPFTAIGASFLSFQGVFTDCNYNPPLWSLAYEIWFYILMGCVMTICRSKPGGNTIIPLLILAVTMYFLAKLNGLYMLIWLIGAMAYFLPKQNIPFRKIKIPALLVLSAGAFGLSQLASASNLSGIPKWKFLDHVSASIFLALVTCLLVQHLCGSRPQKKAGILLDGLGTKLAAFSYTLYLTHYPLMRLLAYWGFPKSTALNAVSVSYYACAITIALIIAWLVYSISEKHTPFIKTLLINRLK
jgi:peptidoglycan/LPS O-acetylase OafA/YrhL